MCLLRNRALLMLASQSSIADACFKIEHSCFEVKHYWCLLRDRALLMLALLLLASRSSIADAASRSGIDGYWSRRVGLAVLISLCWSRVDIILLC
jgi:hypothetical protein